MKETLEVRRKTFKSWKAREVSINIFWSLKLNKFGRFLFVNVMNDQSSAVIIIPENKPNEGWLGLVNRIESFINTG